jgi:hypothetical protein
LWSLASCAASTEEFINCVDSCGRGLNLRIAAQILSPNTIKTEEESKEEKRREEKKRKEELRNLKSSRI